MVGAVGRAWRAGACGPAWRAGAWWAGAWWAGAWWAGAWGPGVVGRGRGGPGFMEPDHGRGVHGGLGGAWAHGGVTGRRRRWGVRSREKRGVRGPRFRLAGEARIGGYGGQGIGGWGTGGPHAKKSPPRAIQSAREGGPEAQRTQRAKLNAAARPLSRRRRGHCVASISIRGRGDRVVAAPPHTLTIQGCGYPNKSGSSGHAGEFNSHRRRDQRHAGQGRRTVLSLGHG